jgi:hypothetical protein
MLDALIAVIVAIWKALLGVIQEVFRQVGVIFSTVWTIVLAFVALVYWFFNTVGAMIASLISIVDQLVFGATSASGSGLSTFLATANTFVPLQETMVFLVSFGALLIALTTYRLIKSWIPTLS